MELFEMINRTTRILECMIVTTIISLYFISGYISIVYDRCPVSFYLVFTSFIYYIRLLLLNPAHPLSSTDGSIRGLCNTCNRVRGAKTRHCYICNRCYNKRDHHCMLIGKCVAEENIRDFYFCLLFILLFLAGWLYHRESKLLVGIFIPCAGGFFAWLSLCISEGKTSHEMLKNRGLAISSKNMSNLMMYYKSNLMGILFPLLKGNTK
ncbi:hypothetical protein PAEPH01_1743 [Pancytospora epiphaga]|nr:hypothetical protein PAEPH01_1743 [Pancytospora epiphaga]